MFDNIGGKIKKVAKVFCWIGIVCSVIVGLFLMFYAGNYDEPAYFYEGLVYIFLGPLFSWLGSLVLYGFGELIERTASIDSKLATPKFIIDKKEEPASNEWKCSYCGKLNPAFSDTCSCGCNKNGVKKPEKPEKLPAETCKCSECGYEQSVGHTHCYKCGAKLR